MDNSQLIGWINDNQELKVENPSFEIDENLSDTEKVDKINALIEEIATPITIEQEEKIVTAKKYYDLLAEESKENIVDCFNVCSNFCICLSRSCYEITDNH